MPNEINLIDSEMTPHRFQIIHIVVDASGEFGGISHLVRPSTIA